MTVGYLGAHQVHLSYSNTVSSVPLLPYLSRSFRADPTVTTALTSTVTNPFFGLPNVTGSLATSTKVSVYTLEQAYPQYSAVTQALVPGASATFNQLLARFYVRQAYGMTLNANYEYSRNLITGQLTPGGPLTYGESTSDYPHHVSVAGTYALPIGKGKHFLSHGNLVDALVGGFQVNAIYQMLSGTPISWGLVDFANGSGPLPVQLPAQPAQLRARLQYRCLLQGLRDRLQSVYHSHRWRHLRSHRYRSGQQHLQLPPVSPVLPAHGTSPTISTPSVIKAFHVSERYRIEYRFEAFNVLNHTQFGSPSVSPTAAVSQTTAGPSGFGTINTIASVNRTIQQGLRVSW